MIVPLGVTTSTGREHAPLALRPIDRPMPGGYRLMTTDDARELARGSLVELWDGARLRTAVVRSFTEDAMNLEIIAPYDNPPSVAVSLEVFDADLDDGPAYPPRSRDLLFVGAVPK